MRRLALYGLPGAGKSTFAAFLADEFAAVGANATVVKLGAPLYELQSLVYATAGRPLLTATQQDGLLLNDLAVHLRRINPDALTEFFAAKVDSAPHDMALICDDMRAPDVEAMEAMGFVLVEVHAPEAVRLARKHKRADLTKGRDDHPTEAPIDRRPAHRIANVGNLTALRNQAAGVVAEVMTR
ncbi:hypothetical protein ACIBG8_45290 [Nonomuraea sp. NPDC050556]|uniref:hypothetical protein n=1 Tax=Nonomuraea sp. NPDC050556 TaxID=3364369 RepID=UPI00379D0173